MQKLKHIKQIINRDCPYLKVGVIGLARSGVAAANLAKTLGAKVFISEASPRSKCRENIALLKKGIEFECGGHSQKLLEMNLIIKSPGVPDDIEILSRARQKKIKIWSELELSARFVNQKKIIAITGTNGKSTTATLIGEVLKKAGRKIFVLGNIGSPLSDFVFRINKKDHIVLEVSSYQLENCFEFHPHICCVLNVSKDHIEHHGSMENYIEAKKRIFSRQTKEDYCVLNYDDKICRKMSSKTKAQVVYFSTKRELASGVFVKDNRIIVRLPHAHCQLHADLKIPGLHNMENVLASVAVAGLVNVKPNIIEKSISEFEGIEHRIEQVAVINGVKYINDSKATNVDSAMVALKAMPKHVWLILGGQDKGFPYTPLRPLVKDKVKGVMLIGEAAKKIKRELSGVTRLFDCTTLGKAVKKAAAVAGSGDTVLLSPACASFDQFKSFEHRGRHFKGLVLKLKAKSSK